MNQRQISQYNSFISSHLDIPAGDFFQDLNDMHRAEMALRKDDSHAFACYCSELSEIHGSDGIALPAVDRAVMLLRILGYESVSCSTHPSSDRIEGMGCRACVLGWPPERPEVTLEDDNLNISDSQA